MPPRRSTLVATLLAAALALTGCTGTPAPTRSEHPPSTPAERSAATLPPPEAIDWGRCDSADLRDAGAQCGMLAVPLDWASPSSRSIRIAVSRVRHTVGASRYRGVIVTNPGGPGASGLSLATLGAQVPRGVGDRYDWIGFDPRGVGASVPALSCIPDYDAGPKPQYEPVNASVEQAWIHRAAAYSAACGKAGTLLDHLTSEDSARDIDYLRRALGVATISYYGFSYGTYLGQVYSTLFPNRLARMVLDSTVDPRGVWYQGNFDQDPAFETTVQAFFAWIAQHDDVYRLGTTAAAVRATWQADRQALVAHPGAGVVGPDEWTDVFLNAGYVAAAWPSLGRVFSTWDHAHDAAILKAEYDSDVEAHDDNEYAMYLAVQCTDAAWPRSYAAYRAASVRVAKTAPYETWDNTWFNAPCLTWPGTPRTPVRIDGSRTRSVLMIDETLDAATPYSGSTYVRGLYPGARLLAEPGGTSHADSLQGDSCVDDRIAAYLATGALPGRRAGSGADLTCAPLPAPSPRG